MTAFLLLVAICLGAQITVLLWNVLTWKLRRKPDAVSGVAFSVLIPARNELHNLPDLLRRLSEQTQTPHEIIVCDDESEDGTGRWLEENAGEFGADWFKSGPRPDGWVGKTWACHQLAQKATGEWLVFVDADVEPEPTFIELFAAHCATDTLMATGLPRIHATGVGDALLVAMVPFTVLSMLPLTLAENHPNPAFAFANGQIIAFARDDYLRLRPHEHVKFAFVEDVQLARFAKRHGGTVRIADLTAVMRVHMYQSMADAIDGFSKNAVEIAGGVTRAVLFAAFLAVVYLGPLILVGRGLTLALAPVIAAAGLYGATAAMSGLPLWYGLLYPLAMVMTVVTLLRSAWWHATGRVRWKGRIYRSSTGSDR